MDNRQKRKAQAMGVFLNVETHRKFMKMSSSQELEQENKSLKEQNTDLVNQVRILKRQAGSRCFDILDLRQEISRLMFGEGHSSDTRTDDEPDDNLIQ